MENRSQYKPHNRNPRENANFLSVWSYFFTLPTFILGYRKEITEDDIYETLADQKSSTLDIDTTKLWKNEIEEAFKNKKRPSLRKVLLKLLLKEYLTATAFISFSEVFAKPMQVFILGELISNYSEPKSNLKISLYTFGIIVALYLQTLAVQPSALRSYVVALKIRVMCASLIYRKVLSLSKESLSQTTPGHILNLVSNDINVFEKIMFVSQYLWTTPLQTVVILGLLYKEIGVSSILGVTVLVFLLPVYTLLGKLTSKYRMCTSTERDHRLRLMNEIIHGINVIKMYAWEKPFAQVLNNIRNQELYYIKLGLYIKSWYLSYATVYTISMFVTIVSSVLLNQSLNAKAAFVVAPLLYTSSMSLNYGMPQGFLFLREMKVSLDRITSFLLLDEVVLLSTPTMQDVALKIEDGVINSSKYNSHKMFSDLNFEIKLGSLNAIIGSVGSGKSTLLNIILEEIPMTSGRLLINGSISYASQEPWIFCSTVRQNILFGSEMDETRYNAVIKCCALERDLKLLPYGDKTTVGEKGTSLSGGQKARINLARAVYRKADIYLLDDPLSAVDAHVGKQIFDQCIQTFLKGKTVLLVTHQLQYLNHVDYVMVILNGSIVAKGTRNQLTNSGFNFLQYIEQGKENVSEQPENSTNVTHVSSPKDLEKSVGDPKDSSYISFDNYKYYFLASKNYLLLIAAILFFVLTQVAISATQYFLAYWVNAEQEKKFENNDSKRISYLYTFSTIALFCIAFTILKSFYFVNLATESSKVLHETMFKKVVYAVIKFFHLNSSGVIINRFAKDLPTVDEMLPVSLMAALRGVLSILGIFVVICFVNAWFLVPTILVLLILYYLRRFYLTTSLNLFRVEGQLRGPIYSHFNASLQGLATIRAFGVKELLTSEFYYHQDMHSSSWYMAMSTTRAFGYWADLTVVLYVAMVSLYYLFNLDNERGNIGLVISQALQMSGQLAWCIRQVNEMENYMISVERICEYNTLPQEEGAVQTKQLSDWPTNGEIKFLNVNLKYSEKLPYVLKDLHFTINPLEKVGIVGRTGAGKSSIISALFRLVQIEGSILIDNVNVQNLSLNNLRKSISIIPQDPVLFSGSIRYNLDPFVEYDDDTLWRALEEVRLKQVVSSFSSGLNFEISQDGSNFSVGQRQLICLARAIVRNNKILLLDEATANVDLETDKIIQETIRKKFEHCTVLTIAHRLNTVMDSDRVLVMDAGVAVEFDHPYLLLQNRNGVFYNLVQHTEKVMAETLENIARENYSKSIQK